MTCQVKLTNKKTGVVYIYESESYWDADKKQPRNRRTCIGKLCPDTGKLIPSKRLQHSTPVTAQARSVGPRMVLEHTIAQLNLLKPLKQAFPEQHEVICAMAAYLVCCGGPLSQAQAWARNHYPELSEALASQRISECLQSLTHDHKQTFLKHWMQQAPDTEHICYDITSISSYARNNELIEYGYNRDKESLPQLNLALLCSHKDQTPLYFEVLPGSIGDVSTPKRLMETFKKLQIKRTSFVMDRGFYSQANVNRLLKHRHHFLMGVPAHNRWVQALIDKAGDMTSCPDRAYELDDELLFACTSKIAWGDQNRRCYAHLYYNPHIRAAAVERFHRMLKQRYDELLSGISLAEHPSDCDAFFILHETPKRGRRVKYNQQTIAAHIKKYVGYQVLLSSRIKDPVEAIRIYRNKDVIEKCFDDLKNKLDMKRLRVHSKKTSEGRLLLQFIALILRSGLKASMRSSGLSKTYSVRELLQELETIMKIQYSNKRSHIITEMTKRQKHILTSLDIQDPTNL